MGNTIYASFADPDLAERAAGALLDFGVQPQDVSLVQGPRGEATIKNYGTAETTPISDPASIDGSTYNTAVTTRDPEPVYEVQPPVIGERIIGQPNQFGTTSTSDLLAPSDTIGSEVAYRDEEPAEDKIEGAAKHGISTTTAEDAEAGAVTGAAWGTGIGVLAALAALAVPGFGLVAGGGALAIAIGGVVASAGAGAAAGAVTGYLKDQGVDSHIAENYQRSVGSGGAFLAVTVPSGSVGEFEARNIMEKYGASNLNVYASRGYLA